MKIILVLSQKGGSGKSTVARNLAVLYSKEYKTALLDLDPQGSTIKWGEQRNEDVKDNELLTHFLNIEDVDTDFSQLEKNGYEYIVIDTPPVLADVHEFLLQKADYGVVPIQTTREDLETLENTTTLIENAGIYYGVVINRADMKTIMYKEGKNIVAEYGKILGTIKETVQMQYCSYDCLGINEVKIKNNPVVEHNQTEFVKIKKNIDRTLRKGL